MKALVMEVRGREAAILMMDGTVRVVRGRYEVGDEIDYAAPSRPSALQWVAAILVAALLLGGSAGLWINDNYIAYAEVSLDVSPSPIVYTLNRRNRVLSVKAVGEDGAGIVEALDGDSLKFAPIGDAVERTMSVLEEKGYMDSEAEDYVLASVSADDERRRDTLTEQVDAAMTRAKESDPTMEYRIEPTDRATAKVAGENGMTPGRYNAWRTYGDESKPEEYKDMPVREIFEREAPEPQTSKPDEAAAPVPEPQADKAPSEQRDTPEDKQPAAQPDHEPSEKSEDVSKPLTEPAEKPAEDSEPDKPYPTGITAYFAGENDAPAEGNAPSARESDSAPSEPAAARDDDAPSESSREEHSAPERESDHAGDRSSNERDSGPRGGGESHPGGGPGPGGGRP